MKLNVRILIKLIKGAISLREELRNKTGCSGVPMTGLGNHFINKDLQSTNLANLFMEALVI